LNVNFEAAPFKLTQEFIDIMRDIAQELDRQTEIIATVAVRMVVQSQELMNSDFWRLAFKASIDWLIIADGEAACVWGAQL